MGISGVKSFQFADAAVVLIDSMTAARKTTRDALYDFGFRDFDLQDGAAAARKRMASFPSDILICAAELPDNATASLFADIRHGDLGSDPFIPMIATIWEPEVALVKNIVGAGADHILTLPTSRGKIRKAIDAIIEARKPFVVTSEYVGPDRRNDTRDEADRIPRIPVPNSLRHKATGDDGGLDPREVMTSVQEQRIERYVNKVVVTAQMISNVASITAGQGPAAKIELRQRLAELHGAANDLHHRIVDTRFRHQTELCKSLVESAERLRRAPAPPKKDLDLLQQLALAIQVAIKSTDDSSVAAAMNITSIVREAYSDLAEPRRVGPAQGQSQTNRAPTKIRPHRAPFFWRAAPDADAIRAGGLVPLQPAHPSSSPPPAGSSGT